MLRRQVLGTVLLVLFVAMTSGTVAAAVASARRADSSIGRFTEQSLDFDATLFSCPPGVDPNGFDSQYAVTSACLNPHHAADDIIDSPDELEALVRARNSEGVTARLSAGFCWPWSNPRSDGTLVADVALDTWSMPWNAKPDARKLAPGIPKSHYWTSDPAGIDQVGCVYTARASSTTTPVSSGDGTSCTGPARAGSVSLSSPMTPWSSGPKPTSSSW